MGREFPGVDKLRALAEQRGVELIAMSGPADASEFRQRLAAIVGECGADDVELCFCGPSGLLQRVRSEMAALGVPDARLRFERFEFR